MGDCHNNTTIRIDSSGIRNYIPFQDRRSSSITHNINVRNGGIENRLPHDGYTSIIESARETHTVDSNNIYESVTIVIEL